jgi:hypothetical protein
MTDLFAEFDTTPCWSADGTPLARPSHPQTSHDAADEFRDCGQHAADMAAALAAVKRHPGCTAAEIEAREGTRDGKIRKRLAALADTHGLIRRGTARTCGVTGKTAQTWEAV